MHRRPPSPFPLLQFGTYRYIAHPLPFPLRVGVSLSAAAFDPVKSSLSTQVGKKDVVFAVPVTPIFRSSYGCSVIVGKRNPSDIFSAIVSRVK